MNLYRDILELVNPAAKKARIAEERRKEDAEKAAAEQKAAEERQKAEEEKRIKIEEFKANEISRKKALEKFKYVDDVIKALTFCQLGLCDEECPYWYEEENRLLCSFIFKDSSACFFNR